MKKKIINKLKSGLFRKYCEITDKKTPYKHKVWVKKDFFKKFSNRTINLIVGCGHELPTFFDKYEGKPSCYLRKDNKTYHDQSLTICNDIETCPDILCHMNNNNIPILITLFKSKKINIREIVGCGLSMDGFYSSLKLLTTRIFSYGGIWPPVGYKV